MKQLTPYQKRRRLHHAMGALQAQLALQQQGGIHQLMLKQANTEGFAVLQHYPKGDRIDYESGGQYYYHCHRENFDTEEHGHIHCFIRQKGHALRGGWASSYQLADIPEKEAYMNSPMTHVVAIGLNRLGQPIRLFTVNRWVTKESWFDAPTMHRLRHRFKLGQVKTREKQFKNWQLADQWIEHLVHLYGDQIDALMLQRDAAMRRFIKTHPKILNPYEDRSLEELSSIDINLEVTIRSLMA